MSPDARPAGDYDLLERRLQSLKGEARQFIEACLNTRDPAVRRSFRGLVGGLHKVVFDE